MGPKRFRPICRQSSLLTKVAMREFIYANISIERISPFPFRLGEKSNAELMPMRPSIDNKVRVVVSFDWPNRPGYGVIYFCLTRLGCFFIVPAWKSRFLSTCFYSKGNQRYSFGGIRSMHLLSVKIIKKEI
jgi:hypothetical protein